MIRRLEREQGWAMVIAISVMLLMLSVGLAAFSYVDTQTRATRGERTHESAFDYAEAVLNEQSFQLANYWPSQSTRPIPDCASSATTWTQPCPSANTLKSAFTSQDFASGASWSTQARDNSGSSQYFYDPDPTSGTRAQAHWDSNGDGMMWVWAKATVRGRTRTLVSLIGVRRHDINFPENVVTAGSLTIDRGSKGQIDTQGAPVELRCPLSDANCLSLKRPNLAISPYTVSNPPLPNHLLSGLGPGTDMDALKRRAQAENGYYLDQCPPSTVTSSIVYVDVSDGHAPLACDTNGNPLPPGTPTNPGVFILVDGSLTIRQDSDQWNGVIYLYNRSLSNSPNLFYEVGNTNLFGAVAVDGPGGVDIGASSNTTLNFASNVFNNLFAFDFVGNVRNSFRELNTP